MKLARWGTTWGPEPASVSTYHKAKKEHQKAVDAFSRAREENLAMHWQRASLAVQEGRSVYRQATEEVHQAKIRGHLNIDRACREGKAQVTAVFDNIAAQNKSLLNATTRR